MTEEAETAVAAVKKKPAKKAVKKPAAKKAAPAKKAVKKPAAKKAVAADKPARKAPAKKAAGKRGRPAAKKTGARRGKKGKQFAYLLLTPGENPGEVKASTINGPFSSDKDALDDASIMADETTTIVLFRETKRGKVQKSTKFVAGR